MIRVVRSVEEALCDYHFRAALLGTGAQVVNIASLDPATLKTCARPNEGTHTNLATVIITWNPLGGN